MSKCGCNEGIKGDLHPEFRNAIKLVIGLNLAYFFVEFCVARAIGSVSLYADSIDFLEDASVNGLILLAMGWTAVRRARIGMVLAGLILIPSAAALWTAWQKFTHFIPPSASLLSVTGAGALAVGTTVKLARALGLGEDFISAEAAREFLIIERRRGEYARLRPAADVVNRTAIVVDDGVATPEQVDQLIHFLSVSRQLERIDATHELIFLEKFNKIEV